MRTSLLAVLLLALVAAVAGAGDCNTTADFITEKKYTIAPVMAPAVEDIFVKNWTGTIFLPSNSAMMKLQETLKAGAGLEELPQGYDNWTKVFEIPGLSEVLLYHLLPKEVLDPSEVKASTTLGPFKTELSKLRNTTFCEDADGELSVRVNVTSRNTTAYVLDGFDPKNPAKVTGNQTVCEGTIMLIDRVLLPCANSSLLNSLLATLKKLGDAAATNKSTNGSNTTTRGLPSSPASNTSTPTAPNSASAAAQSLVAVLACSVALLAVFLGF